MKNLRRLLFLPGIGGDPDFWRPLGERLPASWEKIYLGWSGLGNFREGPPLASFQDMVAQVERRLAPGPVDLLAQSLGGVVALAVALGHPTRVRRLVLAATSGGLDVRSLGASDWRAEYRAAFPHVADWVYGAWPDFSGQLSKIPQPTLLLWGDRDPISPLAIGERLCSLLPRATLEVVQGADHDLVKDRAKELAPSVQRHLEPLPGSPDLANC